MSNQKLTRRERSEQAAQQARTAPVPPASNNSATPEERRHFKFGWWSLFVFVCLGITLEMMLAFRVGWYMDVDNDTRRLMLRLGHAHGTLLSLVNIAFATTLTRVTLSATNRLWASRFLTAATLLIPGGFILGGLQIHNADPGLGIILLPAGAVLLLWHRWARTTYTNADTPFGSLKKNQKRVLLTTWVAFVNAFCEEVLFRGFFEVVLSCWNPIAQ